MNLRLCTIALAAVLALGCSEDASKNSAKVKEPPSVITVHKVMVKSDSEYPMSLQQYFAGRNFPEYSLVVNKVGRINIFRDYEKMKFRDSIMFTVDGGSLNPLEVLTDALNQLVFSAPENRRACQVHLAQEERKLTFQDFAVYEREIEDEPKTFYPVTILSLEPWNLEGLRWFLRCQQASGDWAVEKQGNYAFINFKVYENIHPELKGAFPSPVRA